MNGSVSCIRVVLVVCLLVVAVPVFAADPRISGMVQYRNAPVDTTVRLDQRELSWLGQVFDLMGSSDFTFIYRRDRNHWIGLYRDGTSMAVQMHDETTGFDARAVVNQKTGALSLIKGVVYSDTTQKESIELSAKALGGYIRRVLDDKGVFGAPASHEPVKEATHAKAAKEPVSAGESTGHSAEKSASKSKPEHGAESSEAAPWSSKEALRLKEGNLRYVKGSAQNPRRDKARRTELAKSQSPFSVVITCSDSRVPPELLFDQGLGDVFVVRTAGEVLGPLELGSVEYAVEHLKSRHILVLGHTSCGAVKAAVEGGKASENISSILAFIKPSVERAKITNPEHILNESILGNIRMAAQAVKGSPVLAEFLESGLSIDLGIYNLETGIVDPVMP